MRIEAQQGVLRGIVGGAAITWLTPGLGIVAKPIAFTPEQRLSAAFAPGLRWHTLLVACVAANIGLLARHRFFTSEARNRGASRCCCPGASDRRLAC